MKTIFTRLYVNHKAEALNDNGSSKNKSNTSIGLVALFLFVSIAVNAQNRVYVSSTATGQNNGSSWANGYTSLQGAIDASSAGDTIWVKQGTYLPTKALGTSTDARSKSFILDKSIHIYGGFSGTEARLNQRGTTAKTILSGDLGIANDSSDNAYHVVVGLNYNGTLNTLEIKHGNASGTGSDVVSGFTVDKSLGGGLYLDSCAARIEDAHIHNNNAIVGGAGIYNYKGSSAFVGGTIEYNRVHGSDDDAGGGGGMFNMNSQPTISGSLTFQFNYSIGMQGGGGMRNEDSQPQLTDVLFLKNVANGGDGGGGIYNLSSTTNLTGVDFIQNTTNDEAGAIYNDGSLGNISGCYFYNNTSGTGGGGAMENDGGSHVVISDCHFEANHTLGSGGAMQNWKSSIELHRVTFTKNTASENGGAVYNYNQCSPIVTNCIFSENEALENGGGFYNERDSHPIITSTHFSKNTAGLQGGGFFTKAGAVICNPILTNVTIAYNTAGVSGGGAYDDGTGASKLRNSIIFGNIAPLLDEIDAPITMLATAVFNDIIGNEFYVSGLATPVVFTTPVFSDTTNLYYAIDSAGPAFNTGSNAFYAATAVPSLLNDTNDVRGATRILGSAVDLGAYEICISNVVPTVTLSNTPALPVLENTKVTFTATIAHGGANPVYNWYVNKTAWGATTSPTIIGTAGVDFDNGDTISVMLMSSIACVVGSPADTIYAKVNYIGIKELDGSNQALQLFPNPNRGVFKLKANVVAHEVYQLSITDLSGNLLHKESVTTAGDLLEMEVSLGKTLSAGMYILSLRGTKDTKEPIRFMVF